MQKLDTEEKNELRTNCANLRRLRAFFAASRPGYAPHPPIKARRMRMASAANKMAAMLRHARLVRALPIDYMGATPRHSLPAIFPDQTK
jgi:hypothetical protein